MIEEAIGPDRQDHALQSNFGWAIENEAQSRDRSHREL